VLQLCEEILIVKQMTVVESFKKSLGVSSQLCSMYTSKE